MNKHFYHSLVNSALVTVLTSTAMTYINSALIFSIWLPNWLVSWFIVFNFVYWLAPINNQIVDKFLKKEK